jgi:HEAT repeat protein
MAVLLMPIWTEVDTVQSEMGVADSEEQLEYVLVRQLASSFASNQVAARRGIHELLMRSRSRSLEALYRVLLEDSAGEGEPFVVSLLSSDEAHLSPLLHSPNLDRKAAVRIVRRLAKEEPGLEAMLLRLAVRERNSDALLRILSILEEGGDCLRIAQQLQVLSRQTDERVRAKAARMVVRVSRERDRLMQLLSDPDPRVRANAAEGLFELVPRPTEVQALWQLAGDEHHRPATTALAVLAIHGDTQASCKLVELLETSEERFQLAAAWAMGRVGDPAFLPVLQTVVKGQSGSLKRMSLRSCALIRKAAARAESTALPQAESQPSDRD